MDAVNYLFQLPAAWFNSPFFAPFMGFLAFCGLIKCTVFFLMGGKR